MKEKRRDKNERECEGKEKDTKECMGEKEGHGDRRGKRRFRETTCDV